MDGLVVGRQRRAATERAALELDLDLEGVDRLLLPHELCTRLGLAAFVTAAIKETNIDDLLDLQAYGEGAVLATGCGHALNPADEPAYRISAVAHETSR